MIRAEPEPQFNPWSELDLTAAARSPTAARIVAQLPQHPDWAGCHLRGELDGPFCAHTRTLRARVRLRPHDVDLPLLLTGHVVDPCFWSGELPFLYQVTLEFCKGDEVLGRTTREIGIRPIGVSGPQITLAATPLVFRAVDPRLVRPAPTLDAWRDTNTAMLVEAPDAKLCAACSRSGVMLIADLRGRMNAATHWQELARYPAMVAALFPGEASSLPTRVTGGPLRVCDSTAVASSASAEAWHVDFEQIAPGDWRRLPLERPGLLSRAVEPCASLDEARQQCDRLQRDAAIDGQFAGYLVRARG